MNCKERLDAIGLLDQVCTFIVNSGLNTGEKERLINLISNVQNEIETEWGE